MTLSDVIKGKVFICAPSTPVKHLTRAIGGKRAPVLLVNDEHVRAVIRNYRALVQDHTTFDSPFGIGQLLTNVVRASLPDGGAERLIEILDEGENGWVELSDKGGKPIAWLALDSASRAWLQALHTSSSCFSGPHQVAS